MNFVWATLVSNIHFWNLFKNGWDIDTPPLFLQKKNTSIREAIEACSSSKSSWYWTFLEQLKSFLYSICIMFDACISKRRDFFISYRYQICFLFFVVRDTYVGKGVSHVDWNAIWSLQDQGWKICFYFVRCYAKKCSIIR